jgi:DNA-binding response OmpR family regulator
MPIIRLDGQSILVVEDEPLILVDVQCALEEVGACVLPATTVQEALDLLLAHRITASVIDYKLQGGTAEGLCHQLAERKIPFVIYSGDPNVAGGGSNWEVVLKPAEPGMLVARLCAVVFANAGGANK